MPAVRLSPLARPRARFDQVIKGVLGAALRALGIMLPVTTGCLVTDKVEYDAPNSPAQVFITKPVGPLARVPPFPDCTEMSPGGTIKFMEFVANISDPNIEDQLVARLVINRQEVRRGGGDVPLTGKVDRGPFRFCVDQTSLLEPCTLVEVLVSRDFSEDPPYGVRLSGDLGRDHVMVGGSSEDQPQAALSDCYLDAGVP